MNRHEFDKANDEVVMIHDLFKFPINAMGIAEDEGPLDVVQWLHEHRSHEQCGRNAMNQPSSNGHLHILRLLHQHQYEQVTASELRGAAANGHCDVLDYLRSLNPDLKCDINGAAAAASQDRFQVIEWLERYDPELVARVLPEMEQRLTERLSVYADVEQLAEDASESVDEDYDFGDEMEFDPDDDDSQDAE